MQGLGTGRLSLIGEFLFWHSRWKIAIAGEEDANQVKLLHGIFFAKLKFG